MNITETKRTVAERVVDDLTSAIGRGVYGDRLPAADALAKEFDASRVSVMSALHMLHDSGVITIHHGRPTRINRSFPDQPSEEITPEIAISSLSVWLTESYLQNTHFKKIENKLIRDDEAYYAEFDSGGGEIGLINFRGAAALQQGFTFDKTGQLVKVVVEKRLIGEQSFDNSRGIELFRAQQKEEELGMKKGLVSRLILKRNDEGKFEIARRVTTGELKRWEEQYIKSTHSRSHRHALHQPKQ